MRANTHTHQKEAKRKSGPQSFVRNDIYLYTNVAEKRRPNVGYAASSRLTRLDKDTSTWAHKKTQQLILAATANRITQICLMHKCSSKQYGYYFTKI